MNASAPANSKPNPLLRGAGLALLSALAFGLATPFIQRFGKDSGAWPAAALLYAGAALASIDPWRRARGDEAPVRAVHVPRLLLVALVGAALAPVCLTWGLQRTDAVSASLLLNFEAVFTVVLAWVVHREQIGRRVALALAFMAVGGALLVAAGAPPVLGLARLPSCSPRLVGRSTTHWRDRWRSSVQLRSCNGRERWVPRSASRLR